MTSREEAVLYIFRRTKIRESSRENGRSFTVKVLISLERPFGGKV